jgi:hypothetical protein
MKRTFTVITAAIFAGAMALPAFAQVGAGIAGNANVGKHTMSTGANADIGNSDAERAEPNSPAPNSSMRHRSRSMNSSSSAASNSNRANRGIGSNLGVGANVGGLGANVGAGANAGSNNSPTGGY